MQNDSTSKRLEKFAWIIPVILAFVAHLSVLDNGLAYDDPILFQDLLPRFQSWTGVWNYLDFYPQRPVYYRPGFFLALMFIRTFSNYEPWGYHLTLLLIHTINTVLVYVLSCHFLKGKKQTKWGAMAAAALFAVHPAHIEVVAWISALLETLLTLFFFLALLSHIRFREYPHKKIWLLLATASFFCALTFKETAISFFIIAPLYDYCFVRSEKRTICNLTGAYACYFFIFLFYALLRLANIPLSPTSHIAVSPFEGTMRLVIAFGYYFQKSIWPNVINPYIVNLPMGAAFFAMSLVYIILITAVCWQTLRSARAIFFHISLYIICLGPGILVSWGSSSGVPLAERYLYLPLYGICFIFGWCLTQNDSSTKASEHKQKKMVVKIVFATGIILTSAWLSYQRAEIWQNDWSFWKQAVKMNPRDVAPWSNLGRVALQYGDQPRAMAYFDKALSLKTNQIPNFVLAELYANKAICLKHLNREDEGIAMLEESIRLIAHPISYFNLALLYSEKAKNIENKITAKEYFEKAIKNFESSIELDQNNTQSHYHLAATYETLGNLPQAKKHYEICTKLKPENAWTTAAKKALLNSTLLIH